MTENVTDIIAQVKEEICREYCKYAEECTEKLENGENVSCPLDRL